MLVLISLMFLVFFLIILICGLRSLTVKPEWENDIEEYLKIHHPKY